MYYLINMDNTNKQDALPIKFMIEVLALFIILGLAGYLYYDRYIVNGTEYSEQKVSESGLTDTEKDNINMRNSEERVGKSLSTSELNTVLENNSNERVSSDTELSVEQRKMILDNNTEQR